MTELKRSYKEVIERLLAVHRSEPKRARAYLQSIAYQLAERFPGETDFVKAQLIKASQISISYENPVKVLRELDEGVEKYLRRNNNFSLFDNISISSPAKPRSLDDFEEEFDFLIEKSDRGQE
jgi:hypothetical protein